MAFVAARLFVLAWIACAAWAQAPATPAEPGPEPAGAGRADLAVSDPNRQWGQWRGPLGNGVALHASPPLTWSDSENVRFKVPSPGPGHGSPVVFAGRVFLTAAIPVGERKEPVPDDAPGAHDNARVTRDHQFVAVALDASTGKELWRRTLHEQRPHAVYHQTGTLAAASAVTDGEHVFAFFGSYGLHCLTVDGEPVWSHDLGDMQVKHGHGEGATPALHGDTLVVNWDHEGQSFIVAFDKATGEERWRKMRDEVTSWATPLVVEHEGRELAIVSGTGALRAYDLATGAVVWSCRGLSNNIVASPVAADGYVYAGSSYVRRRMLGIRLAGATGDVTAKANVVWRRQRSTPYVPSPLLHGEWLYFLNHYQGFLAKVRAKTGEEPWRPTRLDGMRAIYSSPVAVGERLFVTDRDGVTLVLSHDDWAPRILARNVLADSFSASAAIVGDALFLRGERFVYCLAKV